MEEVGGIEGIGGEGAWVGMAVPCHIEKTRKVGSRGDSLGMGQREGKDYVDDGKGRGSHSWIKFTLYLSSRL